MENTDVGKQHLYFFVAIFVDDVLRSVKDLQKILFKHCFMEIWQVISQSQKMKHLGKTYSMSLDLNSLKNPDKLNFHIH